MLSKYLAHLLFFLKQAFVKLHHLYCSDYAFGVSASLVVGVHYGIECCYCDQLLKLFAQFWSPFIKSCLLL